VTDQPYLAGLRLAGRRVLVVGGGAVAQRRLPPLLSAGADVVVVAPGATPTVQGMAERGELSWQRRGYEPADLGGAWYALALTDDPELNSRVSADAEAARVFCVRADDGGHGSAVTPATGGPGRAVAVRDGVLDALREGRLDATRRRPGGSTEPDGDGDGVARAGRVALVGGGPGDPGLITVQGRRLLAAADVVVADRLAPQELLAELPPTVEVIDAAKLPRGPGMSQQVINETLVDRARQGKFVVRLKGGDPFVFGRGSEEVDACVAAGVPVTVVPGISSAIAVPALAGIPVTTRGLAQEVVIASAHLAPDDPGNLVDWPAVARLRGTLVLLMGVERLAAIAAVLLANGKDPRTPAAVVENGARPGQRVIRAPLDRLGETAAAEGVRPPAIVVIGPVAGT
jgi:uroporphyrin-III C-methyltransferase/precorrin-2 dehydrogenase/sirohydrochlorin ferrochelatase